MSEHNYMYQVQTELHVKGPQIFLNNVFWQNKIEPKMTKFYTDCFIYELNHPRHTRNMQIHEMNIKKDI
ncbi:hypothetical protein PR048_026687 [Dryococelus australis]|uniref:Uncharacterized protein n=1 Tax=Dryococelus australis TaxID=614101 RepID=A0ABQ9GM20_9NEOP|nr:hypothetical protein PR048_026687 [Dryococelus australis]